VQDKLEHQVQHQQELSQEAEVVVVQLETQQEELVEQEEVQRVSHQMLQEQQQQLTLAVAVEAVAVDHL
jgi:hypothetical protein